MRRVSLMSEGRYKYNTQHYIDEGMEGLSLLEKTVSLCLYSAYVKERKPLSLLISAPPGTGNSELLMKFSENKGVAVFNQGTRYGIYKQINDLGYNLKHLIIPDLSAVLGAHPGIASDLINLISILVEEGITSVQTYYFWRTFNPPLKVGVLCAVSDSDLKSHKTRLSRTGFLSRFLPFTYSYDKHMLDRVLGYVRRGDILKEEKIRLNLPDQVVDVQCDPKYVDQFTEFTKLEGMEQREARFLEHIRILLKSNALMNGRTEVNGQDVLDVMKLVIFLNYKYNVIGSNPL